MISTLATSAELWELSIECSVVSRLHEHDEACEESCVPFRQLQHRAPAMEADGFGGMGLSRRFKIIAA